ncbi:uncharacterized [Tachysurus ichikawai]
MTNRLPSTSTTIVVMSTLARRVSLQRKKRLSSFPREDDAFLRGAAVSSTILISCCERPEGSTRHSPPRHRHIKGETPLGTSLGQRAPHCAPKSAHGAQLLQLQNTVSMKPNVSCHYRKYSFREDSAMLLELLQLLTLNVLLALSVLRSPVMQVPLTHTLPVIPVLTTPAYRTSLSNLGT